MTTTKTHRYTVADVMTRTVVTVTASAEFKEIVAVMHEWKVSALPVIEGEGRVVGVVSEADLLVKEEVHGHRLGLIEQWHRQDDTAKAGSTRAAELMTSPAVTIDAGATLPQAARLMAGKHVNRLPVVSADGTLEGVVSRGDLLKVFLRSDGDLAAQIRREIVVPLFPLSHRDVGISVTEGVVTLSGAVRDSRLIPVAAHLAQGVEGVVGVECELTAPLSAS